MGVCPRTAARRLYSAPHPPSTHAGCDLGAGYRAAPLVYWSPTDTDTSIIEDLTHDCVIYHRTTNPKNELFFLFFFLHLEERNKN